MFPQLHLEDVNTDFSHAPAMYLGPIRAPPLTLDASAQNRVGELYSLVRFLRISPYAYYYCNTGRSKCAAHLQMAQAAASLPVCLIERKLCHRKRAPACLICGCL